MTRTTAYSYPTTAPYQCCQHCMHWEQPGGELPGHPTPCSYIMNLGSDEPRVTCQNRRDWKQQEQLPDFTCAVCKTPNYYPHEGQFFVEKYEPGILCQTCMLRDAGAIS